MTPWVEVHINIIDPYVVKTREVDLTGIPIKFTLAAMNFIDPVTEWFELAKVLYVDQSSACLL